MDTDLKILESPKSKRKFSYIQQDNDSFMMQSKAFWQRKHEDLMSSTNLTPESKQKHVDLKKIKLKLDSPA